MKISLKHQSIEKSNGPDCTVVEYQLNNEMLDMAIAKISGRYPNQRLVVNKQCDELAYVFEGKGRVVVEGKEQLLNAGDVVLIEAGEKYYWEGQMQLFLSCRPAWKKKQHEIVD